MRALPLTLALLTLAACDAPQAPPLTTAADSLAMRIADAHGGLAAWQQAPPLRFDWTVVRDTGAGPVELVRRHHIVDNAGGRHRAEWAVGEDSVAVAILDMSASTEGAVVGSAQINGAAAPDSLLDDAYGMAINDVYWLAAHFKTLDPGVRRALAPDSAAAGEAVLALSFDGVGLTPGDRYWMTADAATGEMRSWTYVLEGSDEASTWAWVEPGEAGGLRFAQSKAKPDGAQIRTELVGDVPADAMTTLSPLFR